VQVVCEAAEVIGRGVASVVSLANPDIVVLGGSVGQQGDLLLETVRAAVQRWAQPISAKEIPIVSSTLGEEAGLLGAAYAAYQRLHS
jgi:predicted NBD/HSP70 family sugar kinase